MQGLGYFVAAISTDIAQEMQNSTGSRGALARGMLRITLILWSGGNIFRNPRSEPSCRPEPERRQRIVQWRRHRGWLRREQASPIEGRNEDGAMSERTQRG
jgi:hypothetical protein